MLWWALYIKLVTMGSGYRHSMVRINLQQLVRVIPANIHFIYIYMYIYMCVYMMRDRERDPILNRLLHAHCCRHWTLITENLVEELFRNPLSCSPIGADCCRLCPARCCAVALFVPLQLVPRLRKFNDDLKTLNEVLTDLIVRARSSAQKADLEDLQNRNYDKARRRMKK